MKFLSFLLLALTPLPLALTKVIPPTSDAHIFSKRQSTFNVSSWATTQVAVSQSGIFANLGGGRNAPTGDLGSIVASPSTVAPNYFYQWIRDTALTYKYLLNQYKSGNSSLESTIRDYISESDKLQHTTNPSGDYYNNGLGEPKFYLNGTAYTDSWGRPQLDGPGIRATVLIGYAKDLINSGDAGRQYVLDNLYSPVLPYNSTIKADLEFVAHHWTSNGFDLWEEVNARHFFTLMVQRRALIEGAELANMLGDPGAATYYTQQANNIGQTLSSQFWNADKNYLITTVNGNTDRSGLDCGTLLGSIHGNGARGFDLYTPGSDEVLATLDAMVNSMKPLYPINNNGYPGVAIGRYPEDIYDGAGVSIGHPWFICTFTSAEILYTAIIEIETKRNATIAISSKNVNFFKRFLTSVQVGSTYKRGSNEYLQLLHGMALMAEQFMGRGGLHAGTDGALSEQFDRFTGFKRGARDLTWSYVSFLTAALAREGKVAY